MTGKSATNSSLIDLQKLVNRIWVISSIITVLAMFWASMSSESLFITAMVTAGIATGIMFTSCGIEFYMVKKMGVHA